LNTAIEGVNRRLDHVRFDPKREARPKRHRPGARARIAVVPTSVAIGFPSSLPERGRRSVATNGLETGCPTRRPDNHASVAALPLSPRRPHPSIATKSWWTGRGTPAPAAVVPPCRPPRGPVRLPPAPGSRLPISSATPHHRLRVVSASEQADHGGCLLRADAVRVRHPPSSPRGRVRGGARARSSTPPSVGPFPS